MFLHLRVLNIQKRKRKFWKWCLKVEIGEIYPKTLQRNIWEAVGCLAVEKQEWQEDCLLMSLH